MKKGCWGGIRLLEGRVYTLAYEDDLVLLAEEEEGMRSMLARLEGYIRGKGLEVNREKTKILRFRRGGGRKRKVRWWWEGRSLEEVSQYKYLGYVFQRNGGQEEQVKDRMRRGMAAMGQVWGIGKRKFGRDWGKRVWMFDALIWAIMGYGAEIWGWRERRQMERVQEKFLKWVLGVDWRVPGYMVREEMQREKLRVRAGRRAWRFEERLAEGKGSEVARRCWEEMRRRVRAGRMLSEWEKERKGFFEERGVELVAMEEGRERRVFEFQAIEERDRALQREERWERIRESKYNRWYGRVKGEGIPGYLKKGWAESRWSRVARYRLGEGVREGRYWEKEESKMCRMCERERETWEHVWEECGRWGARGNWQEMVEEVLGEEGEGEVWIRKLEEFREGGGGEEGGERRERGERERE